MESLAGQLGIADASVLNLYAQRSQASYEHAAEICAVYKYVDFADPDRREELRLVSVGPGVDVVGGAGALA